MLGAGRVIAVAAAYSTANDILLLGLRPGGRDAPGKRQTYPPSGPKDLGVTRHLPPH